MKVMKKGQRLIGDSYPASPGDLERLRRLAKKTSISKSAHIRQAIREYLDRGNHT